jgi:hypothetical protein
VLLMAGCVTAGHTAEFLPWLQVRTSPMWLVTFHTAYGGHQTIAVREGENGPWRDVADADFVNVAEVGDGEAALVMRAGPPRMFRRGATRPTWVAPMEECREPIPLREPAGLVCAHCIESERSKQLHLRGCARFEVQQIDVDGQVRAQFSLDVPEAEQRCTWQSRGQLDGATPVAVAYCGGENVELPLLPGATTKPLSKRLSEVRWLYELH